MNRIDFQKLIFAIILFIFCGLVWNMALAFGEVRQVPFTMDDNYLITVRVAYNGPNGIVYRTNAWLDTAAKGFWLPFKDCEGTGVDLSVARNMISGGNTSTAARLPGCGPLNIGTGTRQHWGYREGRAWWELNHPLIGFEMLADLKAGEKVYWDFERKILLVASNYDELVAGLASYWEQQHQACKVGYEQEKARADLWVAMYCWALTLSGNRC